MSALRRKNAPTWPFIVCDFLNKKSDKSAEVKEVITYISKKYPHPKYKKPKDLRTEVLRKVNQESWRRKSPRFIRCPTTDKLLLTDFQWITEQNDSLRSQSTDSKLPPVNNVPTSRNAIIANENVMSTPYIEADSYQSIDSKKNIVPIPQSGKTTRIRVKKEKGIPGSTCEVINLISDDEDNSPSPSVAECKIKCPICQATFLTYEGVGVHVQMHR